MATVVITFFLFARFSVCKMDADCIVRQRDQLLSRREKRWSMNSQRLEEIVAELMKPISDVRRSFDTDLSALLEEYLTEAGLHALEAGEEESAADAVAPNFAELALLLQQSASIYGRKVDFLYQHVLDVSDTLHNTTQEIANASTSEEAATPSASRRRRKASTSCAEFSHITLEAHAGARREAEAPRPPPTLPRMYIELEPRVISQADAPLHDYAGEPIGLLADFQVTWRLHEGALVDELEGATSSTDRALRPISLVELQAAIEAAAPPPLPPCHEESPPRDVASPLHASTPLPACDVSDEPAPAPAACRRDRKRRSDVKIDDIIGTNVKIVIGKDLRCKLSEVREFSIATDWIKKVVGKRKSHVLSERRKLRAQEPNPPPDIEFTEYDSMVVDGVVEGFAGWSCGEAASATAAAKESRVGDAESDDDGFFEQSSVGDSDASRGDEAGADDAAWRARVLQRAAAAEARGAVRVRDLGARVLRALDRAAPRAFSHVLRAHAAQPSDVSQLLLATLFLANAGNVEVVAGAPLSLDSFSLRLLSTDERLYCAAAAADHQFLR